MMPVDQRNEINPSLIPGVTFGQYSERMAQALLDLVAEYENVGELAQTLTPEDFGAHLVSMKREMMVVVSFLIENAEYIDDSCEWFDIVEIIQDENVETYESDIPSPNYIDEILSLEAVSIAELLVRTYSMYIDSALSKLSFAHEPQLPYSENEIAAQRAHHNLIVDLEIADSSLLLYLTEVSLRLMLHDEILPVFCTVEPGNGFSEMHSEAGGFHSVINYDHLISFSLAMTNAFLRGETLSNIATDLARKNESNVRPALIALYKDLPDIVSLLDGIMFEQFPLAYNTTPFTERLEHWATQGVAQNRPLPRVHQRDEDFVASLYAVEFGDAIYGEQKDNSHANPFSPVMSSVFFSKLGRHLDVTLQKSGRQILRDNGISVSAHEAKYLWGHNEGVALVLSQN